MWIDKKGLVYEEKNKLLMDIEFCKQEEEYRKLLQKREIEFGEEEAERFGGMVMEMMKEKKKEKKIKPMKVSLVIFPVTLIRLRDMICAEGEELTKGIVLGYIEDLIKEDLLGKIK